MKNVFLWVCLLILGFLYLSNLQAAAQDKVVVIPLFGDDATGDATEADVFEGKTFSNDTGTGLTGTMPDIGSQDITPGTTAKGILEGYHDGMGEVQGDADLVSGNIRKGVAIFNINGDPNVVDTSSGDAVAEDILNGKKAWVDGSERIGTLVCPDPSTGDAETTDVLSGKTFSNATATGLPGAMPNVGHQEITPTTSNQTITKGYHDGTGYAKGAGNLLQGNIKAGVDIFGVTGTFPNDGTATTSEVKTGSTFYTTNATLLTGDGTQTLSAGNETVTAGYYEETTLSAVDAKLSAENIKKDINIFGVEGELHGCCICTGTLNGTRWCDNGDGTVTDLSTCLVWLKAANWGGEWDWRDASGYDDAHARAGILYSEFPGTDLSDGSSAGDWRLPTRNELYGLANDPEAVRSDNMRAFTGVESEYYWSSTTMGGDSHFACRVSLVSGTANYVWKDYGEYVWPVRGGH